ncbi:MAG: hypothetical protein IJ338_10415 [Bacteroidaceae bacterium]|nr:hypothetical protein [Bacteroidaceae bacterium]
MKDLIKYTGIIFILIGVAILAFTKLTGISSNKWLLIGLLWVLAGFIGHIVINKYKP